MKLETGHLTSKKKIYALLLAIFGSSVALIGTLKVFANVFLGGTSSNNCSHGHELDYCMKNYTIGSARSRDYLATHSLSNGSPMFTNNN